MNDPENKVDPVFEYVPSPDGIKRVYANAMNLSQSSSDLRLCFGEIIWYSPQGVALPTVVEQRAEITVTHSNLKMFTEYLQAYIRAFELKNGPITRTTSLVNDSDMGTGYEIIETKTIN